MLPEEKEELKALLLKYSLFDVITELKDQVRALTKDSDSRAKATYYRDFGHLEEIVTTLLKK